MKALRHLIQLIKTASDFSETLNIMVQGVRDVLETEAVSIFLVDQEHQEYVLAATQGLSKTAVLQVRVPFGEGLLGLVAEREELLNLSDAKSHARFLLVPTIKEDAYNAYLAVPIVHRRQLLALS